MHSVRHMSGGGGGGLGMAITTTTTTATATSSRRCGISLAFKFFNWFGARHENAENYVHAYSIYIHIQHMSVCMRVCVCVCVEHSASR